MGKWAWLLAALCFLVVLTSIVLRLDAGYPACAGDAACARTGALWAWQLPITTIRVVHRAAASAALVLVIFFVWSSLRSVSTQPLVRDGVALALLMLLLAGIGVAGNGPDAVWGRFANILGGVGLLVLSGRLVMATHTPGALTSRRVASKVSCVGLVAMASTLVLGALIGARFAAAACTSLPDCAGTWWPTAEGWAGLDPLRLLSSAPLSSDASGVALHLLHRYAAAATCVLLGFIGLRGLGKQATRSASLILLSLLILEMTLGSLTAATGASPGLAAVGHTILAGLLLVSIHWLNRARYR